MGLDDNPTQGFINKLLETIGVNRGRAPGWRTKTALYAVFVVALWQGIGQPDGPLLAGLHDSDTIRMKLRSSTGPKRTKFPLHYAPLAA